MSATSPYAGGAPMKTRHAEGAPMSADPQARQWQVIPEARQ
jgi:hypothetical protein